MYYPDEIVEEVRLKNDIVDVVSGYVKIQKKGASYFGLCPFHSEKSPSFSVSGIKQMYYCFGCGAGGNVFTFIEQYENYTFPEALRFLADRAGVNLPEMEYSALAKEKENKRALLLEINKEAAKYFYYLLRTPKGENGYRYLTGRGLSDDTIKKFGLGYSDKLTDDLTKYLKNKGYSDEQLKEAGLSSFDERSGLHDKFWNRVMFPIQDINHRVIGFGGRVMGDGTPKYLNSPETPVFDKSRNLYGLNFARTSRKNHVILCEGYMDVISLHQAGFTEAVASLGTAFTSGQAVLLRRYVNEVLLAYDSDQAGIKAALRAIGILRETGLTGRVLSFEPHKDPDEFIKAEGAEAFQKRIEEAENSFFYEIRILQKEYRMDDPEQKTRFFREIAKKLCDFTEEVERSNYLEAISKKYHIDTEEMRKLVIRFAASKSGQAGIPEKPKSGIQSRKEEEDGGRKAQRILITWLSEEPDLYDRVKEYISAEDFIDPLYKRVAERFFKDLSGGTVNPAGIISLFGEEEEQKQVAALFNTKIDNLIDDNMREKALNDVVFAIKRNSFEHFSKKMGADLSAVNQVIKGKKALEELSKAHISLK